MSLKITKQCIGPLTRGLDFEEFCIVGELLGSAGESSLTSIAHYVLYPPLSTFCWETEREGQRRGTGIIAEAKPTTTTAEDCKD